MRGPDLGGDGSAGRPRAGPPRRSAAPFDPRAAGDAGPSGAAPRAIDGFWLPRHLRGDVLRDPAWETLWLRGGALAEPGVEGAVPVRYPHLDGGRMVSVLAALQQARAVPGDAVAERWEAALRSVMPGLLAMAEEALPVLAACTGYTAPMLHAALAAGDLIDPEGLSIALGYRPTWSVASRWESLPGLPGSARFFPSAFSGRLHLRNRLFRPAAPIDMALGFAAGNVPGTGFIMALLAQLANHAGSVWTSAPAVLVRNSRHEPVFAPWILDAVEAVDPELVAATALLIWDYDDRGLQVETLGGAGLMLAAAGDDTIASLDAAREELNPALRFHRHGHKASFAVIDGQGGIAGGWSPVDMARLAALDSAVWDQNGCLSARVHFVHGEAEAYARALATEMRAVSVSLPRGSTPRRFIHRAFDTYAALEGTDRAQVFSTYDDDFVVALDARRWDAASLGRAVNACQGRVVVVRPVDTLADVPVLLGTVPPANLQSVSVAMHDEHVRDFASEVGARGVTAIRRLGRAAFPQLAYSWDGMVPTDLAFDRAPGHFTTIEFDYLESELAAALAR